MKATTDQTTAQETDRGAASVLAVLATVALAFVGIVAVWVTSVGTSQMRVSQAADLAALAGAEKAWLDRAAACDVAAEIATRHKARVVHCRAVGLDVQVSVRAPLGGALADMGFVSATARAGPPER